jgi:catechol 2,3-dioxygenase-like lactoylglutathione lyase family enzyme
MKAAALALALLAALPASAQTPPPTASLEPPVMSAMVRVAFVVRDIERSKRFYQEAFGYSVRFDGDISRPENRVLLGLKPNQRARFVVLDGERTFSGKRHEAAGIGLLAVSGGATPRLGQPRGNRLATGQAMLAIETSDIARVIARLRALGAPVLAGPIVAHGGRETEIVTSDPDGTRIHVVEQRP